MLTPQPADRTGSLPVNKMVVAVMAVIVAGFVIMAGAGSIERVNIFGGDQGDTGDLQRCMGQAESYCKDNPDGEWTTGTTNCERFVEEIGDGSTDCSAVVDDASTGDESGETSADELDEGEMAIEIDDISQSGDDITVDVRIIDGTESSRNYDSEVNIVFDESDTDTQRREFSGSVGSTASRTVTFDRTAVTQEQEALFTANLIEPVVDDHQIWETVTPPGSASDDDEPRCHEMSDSNVCMSDESSCSGAGGTVDDDPSLECDQVGEDFCCRGTQLR